MNYNIAMNWKEQKKRTKYKSKQRTKTAYQMLEIGVQGTKNHMRYEQQ